MIVEKIHFTLNIEKNDFEQVPITRPSQGHIRNKTIK